MSEHAVLPPSGSSIWVECTAQPLMVHNLLMELPQDKTAADDGTASHWAMAELAAERVVAEGQITDDGHVLTQEMIDGAEVLVNDVVATIPHIPRSEWRVEQRVSMARRIHKDNWGTPDLWAFCAATWTVYIWDYKFGHEYVEVFENWQLIDYLAGILDELGMNGEHEQHVKVVFTIVQPRTFTPEGPVRRWRVESAANLRGYFNRLEMAAEEAMSGFAKQRPNAKCHRCDARHVCQALQRDAYRSAEIAFQAVPLLMTPEALATELSMLLRAQHRLEARVNALTVQGDHVARSGKLVPGFELKKKIGREKWKNPRQALAYGRLLGVEVAKLDALITPRQAREAGMPEEVVASLSERGPAGFEFVEVEESRGRRVFGKF